MPYHQRPFEIFELVGKEGRFKLLECRVLGDKVFETCPGEGQKRVLVHLSSLLPVKEKRGLVLLEEVALGSSRELGQLGSQRGCSRHLSN